MSNVDLVITSLELQLETPNNPFGSYVSFRFIDVYPHFTLAHKMINEIRKRSDVLLVDYEYSYSGIDEYTNLDGLEFTKN